MDYNSEEEEEKGIEKRRLLRREIKNVVDYLQANMTEMVDPLSEKFHMAKTSLNNLVDHVDHTRELTLDVSGLKDLSKVVKAQAAGLARFASRLDFDLVVTRGHDLFPSERCEQLDWCALGRSLGKLFDRPPLCLTMAGPLLREAKTRKPIQRRAKSQISEEQLAKPQTLTGPRDEEDEATNERLNTLLKVLGEIGSEGQSFDLLGLLLHPTNPVQSVENLFDFAFALKEKRVVAGLDKGSGLPVAAIPHNLDVLDKESKKQMVLSISMKDLREASELLRSQGGDGEDLHQLLDRRDPLYDASDSVAQAELLSQRDKANRQRTPMKRKRSSPGDEGSEGEEDDDNDSEAVGDEEREEQEEEEEVVVARKGSGRGRKAGGRKRRS
eukprot:gene7121-7874_t